MKFVASMDWKMTRRAARALGALMVCFIAFVLPARAQTDFAAGTFQGIIQSDSDNDESFGFITIVLTRSGAFSMRFNLGVNSVGHHSYAMSGRFDANGAYHFEGPPITDTRYAIARVIDLQLDSVQSTTSIHGTLTDLTHSSVIDLERVVVHGLSNPAAEAGLYTALFSSGDAGVPSSSGFALVGVGRSGLISAGGRAPDGRPFTDAAWLTVSGRWPVFAKMAGVTNGILSGWLTFRDQADSDFSGPLVWLGPEVHGPNHAFVPSFSGTVNVAGSRYTVPHAAALLQVSSSSNNLHMNLSGDGLTTAIDRDLTLTAGNRFIFSPRQAGDSLAVNPLNGIFAGTFMHPDNHVSVFRGAFLQKQNRGAGVFVERDGSSGNVDLRPQ